MAVMEDARLQRIPYAAAVGIVVLSSIRCERR